MSDFSPALHRFGDVSVRLSVELGRTDMALRDVLALGQGSVVALNRLTDELLDLTANGKVIAQGEVIAQDGKFALRIVSLAGDEGASPMARTAPPPAPNGAPADAPMAAEAAELAEALAKRPAASSDDEAPSS
ncbi:MAG: FliM/FliN family flagellar motor switch protein [Pseudomonadota bacterium]